MLINIVDPSLRSLAGHYFDRDISVARHLADGGHDVHIYSHIDAVDEIGRFIPTGVGYRKLFRADPRWSVLPTEFPWGRQFRLYRFAARTIAADLTEARMADLWIWPTLAAALLKASASILSKTAISGVIHTPVAALGRRAIGIWAWRDAAHSVRRSGHEIRRLGAMDRSLLADLAPALGRYGLRTIARPHEPSKVVVRKTEMRTIGFFGDRRADTGKMIVNDLARACADTGLDVIVQDSASTSVGPIGEADTRVKRYGFAEDLAALMSGADVVVLPYTSCSYKKRYSGIGGLAISCGIPVLAPANTAVAEMLAEYNTGATFQETSIPGIMAELRNMRADYYVHADRAYQAASKWADENGLGRHVAQLMGSIH